MLVLTVLLALLTGVGLTYSLSVFPSLNTIAYPLAMCGILFVVLVVAMVVRLAQNGLDFLDPLVVVSFFYILFFVLKPVDMVLYGGIIFHFTDFDAQLVGESILYALIGIMCFYGGYWANIQVGRRATQWEYGTHYSPRRFAVGVLVYLALSVASLIYYFYVIGGPQNFFARLGKGHEILKESGLYRVFGPVYSYALVVWYSFEGHKPDFNKKLFAALSAAAFFILFFTASRTLFAVLIVSIVTVRWYWTKRKEGFKVIRFQVVMRYANRFILIALALAVFSTAFYLARGSGFQSIEAPKYMQGISDAELVFRAAVAPFKPYEGYVVVINRHKGFEPYALGEDYMALVYLFLPRVVWQSKPDEYGAAALTREMFDAEHLVMSYTILGDLYRNFGPMGIFAGMGLFGALSCMLYRWLRANLHNDLVVGLYGLYSFPLAIKFMRSTVVGGVTMFLLTTLSIIPLMMFAVESPKNMKVAVGLVVLVITLLAVAFALNFVYIPPPAQ